MCAGRTLRQFPLIAEQVGEEVVAPLGRPRGPNHFQSASDSVATMTFAKFILPSKSLILDVGAFWFIAYILSGNTSAVRFAEGVTAGNQRNCFFVIHRHTGKSLSDVTCRSNRIGLSVRPFRIHIDQAHLHRAQRILKITIAAVTLISQPRALRTPVYFFGFPHVRAPAAKTERLETHRLEATFPERIMRSAQEIFRPYFCLIGHNSRRALSRFTLSGQLLRGAKRCCPAPAPPRPSPMRYVPALCHAIRMNSGP